MKKVRKASVQDKEHSAELPAETHTNFPTSGVLEDGASRRERNFGGGEKTILAGEKCIEFWSLRGIYMSQKTDLVVV